MGNGADEAAEHIGAGGTGPLAVPQTGTGGWFTAGDAIPDTGATRLPCRMRMQVISVKTSLNDKELDILSDMNRNLYSKRDVQTKIEVLYTKELCMSHANGCVEIDKHVKLDRFISRRETALPALTGLGYGAVEGSVAAAIAQGHVARGVSTNRDPDRANMYRDAADSVADQWRNVQRIYVLFTSEKGHDMECNPMVDFHGYIDSLAV